MPANQAAQAFWREVIAEVTAGRFTEVPVTEGAHAHRSFKRGQGRAAKDKRRPELLALGDRGASLR
jgi:hypothetical protein